MNIVQIEDLVKHLVKKVLDGTASQKDFIYDFLLSYGHRSQSVGRVRSGERNLAEDKENSIFWKRQLYFKSTKQQDLHSLIDQMKKEKRTESNKIRFLIVTDFKTLLAVDTKTQDTLDVPFGDLAKKFDFFLPWAGMEKAVYQGENPADVKAAEKLAKLFDEIKADNFDEDDLNNKENLHHLNIFLSRLLFCYFAEDTEIFKDKQFTSAISKSNEDGSDLSSLIGRLFKVLNQSSEDRETDLPDYLADFPYVNGGLFEDDIQVPKFTRKSHRILIECGKDLDWSDINPDIFGSMFQAGVDKEKRSIMGQHYTSVPNIMKVIEPLFLNDLYDELEKYQDNINKLLHLQHRLGEMKLFDPACGSGNFLIIAYKELRRFEMELLKRVQELELEKTGQYSKPFSVIQVSQFYGIEIDDFAHEIAILSLWLAEHQMNLIFKDELGELIPSLPLKTQGQILCKNALRSDWSEDFGFALKDEIYILGNPPFVTYSDRNESQKDDMEIILRPLGNVMRLDYVACWFKKGIDFSTIFLNSSFAFVATNSICQGEQVQLFWPYLDKKKSLIFFAYQTFKWTNNAKEKAGVSCVIVGIKKEVNNCFIYTDDGLKISTNYISHYLEPNNTIKIIKHKKSISNLPEIILGSSPIDGGNLILTEEDKNGILTQYPESANFIKPFISGGDFIDGIKRYCLWIEDDFVDKASLIPPINDHINNCKQWRMYAGRDAKKGVKIPYRFIYRKFVPNKSSICIPMTSSEKRNYLPICIVPENTVPNHGVLVIYDFEPYIFAILSTKMHMLWAKCVAGKLESRVRYSTLTYNSFPMPKLTTALKEKLNVSALNILEVREKYSHLTLGKMYDSEDMPDDLKEAHRINDTIFENIYTNTRIENDATRIDLLYKIYPSLVAKE
ncbi:class I SAM-dependent DNA methyltransferase [Acinetobacter bereziniae]|uniref:class I SAM-dependent DNA methyltransferase n=1 Tax=Acinetobacter bereziniae TaxID=106648 RepID=UPI00190249F2|nr:class I SAM-dependent DNA methyltransferase [Acinetobacter bereziniae]MBJ8444173.1 class I SAM-dependent DNA methyltransferase [Acinetobacter bereziniae]